MHIVLYVSGHGYGHASRTSVLIKALAARAPEATFTARTNAASRFFASTGVPIDLQRTTVDTGMAQIDSLNIDEHASAREATAFYGDFDRHVEREARWLREHGADLVVGDIPPLAFAAAAQASVPSFAIGNFTWDWIYSAYRAFDHLQPTIRQAYAQATCTLRLPFHGGFETTPAIVDIPLVARRSLKPREETRRRLGVSDHRPFVLSSFSSYGAELPSTQVADRGNLTILDFGDLLPSDLAYQDIVAAADVVLTKPGYGIVSECIANDTAIVYTSRGQFVEYDVFVKEMPRALRCRFISQDDLLAGRWEDAVFSVLEQPAPPERWRVDGADIAADAIISR